MSDQPQDMPEGPADAPGGPGDAASESQEEMQRRLEEQLKQIRVQDVLAESAVSIINLTARRIAKEDERDLEQGRIGIEAVRALVPLLDGELATQLQSALSELQMLYAREAGTSAPVGGEGGGPAPGGGSPSGQGGPAAPQEGPGQPGQPGTEPPPRLWTPGR